MTQQELAKAIFAVSHLKGSFLLRSGVTSNEYFDKYLFEAQPALLREIARQMAEVLPPTTEVLAGLEMGGIPIATALSLETGIPVCFVRKKAKDYGTRKLAEGASIEGKYVLIIEDVVTSGGQVVESARELRSAGAIIEPVLCVIDRESGGTANLKAEGLTLRSLFTMSALKGVNLEP